MTFSIAFAAGVTPTKWTRIWAERRSDAPLEVFRTDPAEQVAVLHDGRADASLVRLPVDATGLSVIVLYNEVPVVVLAKEHVLADSETIAVTDLAGEHLLQDPADVPEWREVAAELTDGSRRTLPKMRDLDDVVEQVAAGVGIVILPHSLARLHSRKDVVSRPVTGVAETQIGLAWVTAKTTDDVQEFIGIVRGRSAASSRGDTVIVRGEPVTKVKKTAKAKEAARAAREAAAKTKPAQKKGAAPGRTRAVSPKKGKRRGSR